MYMVHLFKRTFGSKLKHLIKQDTQVKQFRNNTYSNGHEIVSIVYFYCKFLPFCVIL